MLFFVTLKNEIGKGKITTCTALTVSGYKLSLKLPDKVKSRFVGTKEKADSPRYKIMLNDILAGECYFNSKDLPENTEIISSEPNTVTATVDVNKLSLRYKGKASSWEVPVYQIYVRNQRASQFAMIYFRQDMFSYETITEMAKWFDFGYLPETSRAGKKTIPSKAAGF